MDWFTDFFGDLFDGFGGGGEGLGGFLGQLLSGQSDNKFLQSLLGMGIGSLLQGSGLADPKIPPVGYQGEIPNYAAVRQRVPMQPDPNRRPGAAGRQYFSDTIFADAPERKPISVADAQSMTRQQAEGIASLAPTYSAPTEQESKHFVTSNPASSVINQMPVDTMEEDDEFMGRVMNAGGRYLGGITDGMADDVRGNIGRDEVRLSDGEFVYPQT